MDTLERLSHDEDGQLRRLHFFEAAGARLAPSLRATKRELRERDLRRTVREPWERGVLRTRP